MRKTAAGKKSGQCFRQRQWLVLALLTAGMVVLLGRAYQVQVLDSARLRAEGEARQLRSVAVKPVRGKITDRNGEILAVSTPLDAIWAHPATLSEAQADWPRLAQALRLSVDHVSSLLGHYQNREFIYLQRRLPPAEARRIEQLGIPGVATLREYGRFYPAGPITGHVLGFTDVDDSGQEGIERSFDNHLAGIEGRKRVLRDRLGRVIEDVESIHPVYHGRDLQLSLDLRVQVSARRHLANITRQHRAAGASAVMLDVRTGEVLAMANVPDFNPNNRADISGDRFRNRAVTDQFEPGSTIKPFTLSMALASGQFTPQTPISTSPGIHYIGRRSIRDIHNYGDLTLSGVLIKSSNIGAAKIAMKLAPEKLFQVLSSVGFGRPSGIELPGEQSGSLLKRERWRPIEHATLAYGYGLSATPLQLARAYAVLASGGLLRPVTIHRRSAETSGQRVLPTAVVQQITDMLERVVSPEGTARRAAIAAYRVAGKTGTVHKIDPAGGYLEDRYQSLFAGFAPVSDPRFVLVVVVDDPRGDKHYGGEVAAPAFAHIMADALRLHGIRPDAGPDSGVQVVARANGQEPGA